MSQLVRLEGKHSTQNAHCALGLSYKWPQFIETLLKAQPNAQRVAIYVNAFQHISIRCVPCISCPICQQYSGKQQDKPKRFNTFQHVVHLLRLARRYVSTL